MQRTIAEAMVEKGRREGLRDGAIRALRAALLRQLRTRFRELPEATVAAVQACRDVDQLDAWLDRLVVAKTLKDVGIQVTR